MSHIALVYKESGLYNSDELGTEATLYEFQG